MQIRPWIEHEHLVLRGYSLFHSILASYGRHNTLYDDQTSPHLQDGQKNIRV
jgi:hypothetical protein